MVGKFLSVVSILAASFIIGYNSITYPKTIKALPLQSYLELPALAPKIDSSAKTVDININLKSNEVAVKGTAETTISITQADLPIIKRKIVVKEVKVREYPKVSLPLLELPSILKTFGYE